MLLLYPSLTSDVGMFKQMCGAILMGTHTFRAISELHIGIGYIGLAADRALMTVHCARTHLGLVFFYLGFGAPAAVIFTLEAVLPVDLIRIEDLTLDVGQVKDQNVQNRRKNGASDNGTAE